MQIVSIGDNLHEMLAPFFWGKYEKKCFSMLSTENFTQNTTALIIHMCAPYDDLAI